MAKNDKKSQAAESIPPEVVAGATNLEKIRDILFGQQVRRHDAELTGLEKRLQKSLDELRADLKSEAKRLGERLDKERSERGAADDKLRAALKESVAKLGEQLADAERTLQEELKSEAKVLRDEMQANHSEVSAALERAVAELQDQKTDRAALASLFRELAAELAGDGKKKR